MRCDYVDILQRKLAAFVDSGIDCDRFLKKIIRGEATREEYFLFLWATFHYVRWSGRLLAATARGLRKCGRYPWLVQLVDAKSDEESPHDGWVLQDLERLGADVQRMKAPAAPDAVDAYVHFSLAMAEEGSPGFLGAAYTLELISMRRAKVAADNLCARKAIPNIEQAVSFLRGHGDADSEHIAELTVFLRRIEDRHDQEAILLSADVMCALYPRFFR